MMVLRAFWGSPRADPGGKKAGSGLTCSLIKDLPTFFEVCFCVFLFFLLDMLMFFCFFFFFSCFLMFFCYLCLCSCFFFSFFFLSEVI